MKKILFFFLLSSSILSLAQSKYTVEQVEKTNDIRVIANFIKNEGKKPVVDYNKLRHQHGGDACGVYSINFILRLLRGDSFQELTTKRLSDEKVNECRKFYFT